MRPMECGSRLGVKADSPERSLVAPQDDGRAFKGIAHNDVDVTGAWAYAADKIEPRPVGPLSEGFTCLVRVEPPCLSNGIHRDNFVPLAEREW